MAVMGSSVLNLWCGWLDCVCLANLCCLHASVGRLYYFLPNDPARPWPDPTWLRIE